VGAASEAVAPGLRAGWYVHHGPVQYARDGLASWAPRRAGLSAWLARVFDTGGKSGAPVAVAALGLDLPVPSMVQVINPHTLRMVTVRVDDKARLGGSIIRLPAEAAEGLGADPGRPLPILLRYVAPVLAFNEPPTLRYALLGPARRLPGEPEPVLLAQARPEASPDVPEIRGAEPEPPALRAALLADAEPLLRGPLAAPSVRFRIQAGAFAQRANAERAASRVAPAGRADIVPLKHGSGILYRVVVGAPADATTAEQLRVRVSQIGFADARLVAAM
jgi:rare lipoprotein A